jgi:hypothetical protein
MPIILASQEAEIRRITIRSQPGQIVEILSQKYLPQKGQVKWLKMQPQCPKKKKKKKITN